MCCLKSLMSPLTRFGDQTRHVLDGNHVGAQCGHLFGLVQEVGVGEYGFRILLSEQTGEESDLGIFGVDRVADGAVGDAAVLLHILDGRLHVVHVVQGVEDAHDAQSALDGVAAEAVDDFVGIRGVAEQVAAARKGGQLRNVADGLVNGLQTGPRIFVQIAHHGVGNGAAPNLHGVEVSLLIEGEAAVDLRLIHTGCERGLLSVAQRKISDFQFFTIVLFI